MMTAWAATEQLMDSNPNIERVCWFLAVDGSGGLSVSRVKDAAASGAMMLQLSLMLGEFLEMEGKQVVDLEGAMPAITAAMAHITQ
jgi:hypothetical protein